MSKWDQSGKRALCNLKTDTKVSTNFANKETYVSYYYSYHRVTYVYASYYDSYHRVTLLSSQREIFQVI